MGFGEGKNDEMENGKLFIWFGKELQSGTLNEGEWAVLLVMEIKKKKGKPNTLGSVFRKRGWGILEKVLFYENVQSIFWENGEVF